MYPSTKEFGKDIEGIVHGRPTALLMVFQSFSTILVVDFPRFRISEDFIR
jgi:hypothetical protein